MIVGVINELTFQKDEDGDDDYEFYGVLERAVDVAAQVGNEEEGEDEECAEEHEVQLDLQHQTVLIVH